MPLSQSLRSRNSLLLSLENCNDVLVLAGISERTSCTFLALWLLGYLSLMKVSAQQWAIGPGAQSPDYPIPAGVDLVSCEQPLKNGNADTRLNVDPSSEAILLMAQGPRLQGSVKITTGKHDSVKFFVRLTAYDGEDKDTIVCSLKRANGESGVGIFVSSHMWSSTWKPQC